MRWRRANGLIVVGSALVAAIVVSGWFVWPVPSLVVADRHPGHPVATTNPPCTTPPRADFIPEGAIDVEIAQYSGLNDNPALAMTRSAELVRAVDIVDVTRQLNELPAFPCGSLNCPSDDGAYFRVEFTSRGGNLVSARLSLHGCSGLYLNGAKTPVAWAATSPAVYDLLDRILSLGAATRQWIGRSRRQSSTAPSAA